jgi:hypothetical protein
MALFVNKAIAHEFIFDELATGAANFLNNEW